MYTQIFGNMSKVDKNDLDKYYLPEHSGRYIIINKTHDNSSFTVEVIATPTYAKQVYTEVKEFETVQYYRLWYNNKWSAFIYNITREFNEQKEREGIPSQQQIETIVEEKIKGIKFDDKALLEEIKKKVKKGELNNKLRKDTHNEWNPNNEITFQRLFIRHDLHLRDISNGSREYSININGDPKFLRIYGGRGRVKFGSNTVNRVLLCTGNDQNIYTEHSDVGGENIIRGDRLYYRYRRFWKAHYNFPFDPGDKSANAGADPGWKNGLVNSGRGTRTEPSNGGGFRAPDDARDIIVQQYENTNMEVSSCIIYFAVHGPSFSIKGAHFRTLGDEYNARYIAEEKRLIRDYGFSYWSQDVVWVKVYYR